MKTILIVDDEPRTREGVRKVLESWSAGRYEITTSSSAVEALEWLEANEANLVITDIRMPEINGLELVEKLRDRQHPPVVIVISGHPQFDYAHKALQFGVIEYLLKPLDKKKLVEAVELAFRKEEELNRIERMERLVDTKLLETSEQETQYSAPVKESIQYLDEHLHEPVTMRDIADHLHMNASYFSVLFKEQTGLTFSDYLTRRRVQRAKELLTGTRLSINEIAEKAGYQTAKYFVKVFRSHEGVSPGQYRKNVSHAEETIQ
ncbi:MULTISPECIES: response regulator [unclassified Paenibacillus]|uniref:response regulator transcription factor n=1 Tax=unclassified Paenibacillus TaxID=185978 RepID=UPI0010481065|nr:MULTISPECIES: response regulator [unclassified Paenibacillus]NIK69517.1 YesN/AraC family two-component response regulator [Paenibacillus sp. BK720]TCM95695.1 helix-turn-helix protein [Paenibacillus sp. BK033]